MGSKAKSLDSCHNHDDFARNLSTNGFSKDRQCGSHEVWHDSSGAQVVLPSHGNKDYGKGLCRSLAKAIAILIGGASAWFFFLQPILHDLVAAYMF